MIKEPVFENGHWVVELSNGRRIPFEDGETAEDFYLINRHIERAKHGNSSEP